MPIITKVSGTAVTTVTGLSEFPCLIEGPSRSGRTRALLELWRQATEPRSGAEQPWLLLAATGDRRLRISQRLTALGLADRPHRTATPLGLIRDEILLHWPLLRPGQPEPLLLASETELALALTVWESQLPDGSSARQQRWVRQQLDRLLLMGLAAQPLEQEPDTDLRNLLEQWCDYLTRHSLISYGLECQLLLRHLLPDPAYGRSLGQRVAGVCGDDADDYPPLLLRWLAMLQTAGVPLALSCNPDGAVRLGQGADPVALEQFTAAWPRRNLGGSDRFLTLPERPTRLLHRITRQDALRLLSRCLAEAIARGEVAPGEIAILGPGLDSLGSYLLGQMLTEQGIASQILSEQRPLQTQAPVRALLTLLTLVVPGLGREISLPQLAEMLTVLSRGAIDPVRAALLARHCFRPGLAHPQLLPYDHWERWDRLSHRCIEAYEPLRTWIDETGSQGDLVTRLEAAIAHFCPDAVLAPGERQSLRALEQSAHQYLQVQERLGRTDLSEITLGFLRLLRSGAFSADPQPRSDWQSPPDAVQLATVYQYRQTQQQHRWQVWLDVGSPLWGRYGPCLEGFDHYLQDPAALGLAAAGDRRGFEARQLEQILRDLGARCGEQLILVWSDYSVAGQEQTGPLLGLLSELEEWEPADRDAQATRG